MTNHHQELARQIVEDFRDSLAGEAREYVTESQFGDLAQAIQRALAHERGHIVDLMEAVLRSLRSGLDKPELGL
ncbi:MAG: hypothetical protein OEN52_11505 [Gammaproteobacteria bacterium]|nr:hypothetical protein [Gammaproteobacteria bacterium]MDH3561566.1 hypothetical protein [Gammaproteobacteria bacterium]